MNKGITVLQNIQLLKRCKEYSITPLYNILIDFPHETKNDNNDHIKIIDTLFGYYPPGLVDFEFRYGSPIYNDQKSYNLKQISNASKGKDSNSNKLFNPINPLTLNFKLKRAENYDYKVLKSKLSSWRIRHFFCKSLFFYQNNGCILIIKDFRANNKGKEYILKNVAKELFLYCDEIKSKDNIRAR